MWDVRVCVACLATDVKMYSMSANSLLQPYHLLAGVQFDSSNDYMPQKLCWECAGLVTKYNLFRRKCERAYLLLQDIYNQHDEIMNCHVKEIDREQHKLFSPLSIIHIPSYTLKSRNIKTMRDMKREPVVAPVKHEFEIQIVKAEHDLVKYEPDSHFNIPSADSDCNEAADSDSKNLQEPNEEETSFGELNVIKEGVKEVSLEELGWTEIALTQEQANEYNIKRKKSSKFRKSKYKCVLCYHGFQDQSGYKKHMSRHDPHTGPYECDICKMRFIKRESIWRHIYLKHTMKYHCKVCNNDFFSRDVARHHLELHSKFGQLLKTRPKREKKLKHKLKRNDFEDRFEVVEHIQTQEQMMEVIRDRQFAKGYKAAPFKCSLCYKVFLEEKTYKNHSLQHDPATGDFECDVCKVRVETQHKLYQHISKSHSRSYRCKICSNVCYTRNMAQDHHQRHKGVKYICHICGATFSRNAAMANHVHRKHPSPAESHICAECGSSFPTVNGLRTHKLIMHRVETVPEEKAPYCEYCKVQFTSARAWTQHNASCKSQDNMKKGIVEDVTEKVSWSRRRHSDTSKILWKGPQPCIMCGETMENRRQYWSHFRRAHPGAEYPLSTDNAYVCEQCGKHFQCAALLRMHKPVHTDTRSYRCALCPKAFLTPVALKVHTITHSDERPHKCDFCPMAFKFKTSLTRHFIVHTGEKPYGCEVCAQSFTTRHWLLIHVRKVHNKEHIPTKPRIRKRKPPT